MMDKPSNDLDALTNLGLRVKHREQIGHFPARIMLR
jgi:hypothetical protein